MKNRMTNFTKLGAVLSVLTLTACGGGTETKTDLNAVNPSAPVDDWRLVWSDEFDGTAINADNWTHEVNCLGGGNQEKQCYTDTAENSSVSDGMLKIVAKAAPEGSSQPYTSARMTTQNKVDIQYGRVEMRAKLPKGQGSWPAFWMMPTDSVYGGWPKSGEIDIMEAVNLGAARADGTEEKSIYGTIHYGAGPGSDFSGNSHSPTTSPADSFNTYAIEWQEGEIRWYFNNVLYATQRQSKLRTTGDGTVLGLSHRGWYAELYDIATGQLGTDYSPAPFDQDFFMILNVAVGGQWPEGVNEGGIDASAFAEGQTLEVDYVRVYKCSADPDTGRGCETVAPGYDIDTADGGMLVEGRAPAPTLVAGAPNPITIFDDEININWVAWDCCGGSTPGLVADDAERGNVYEFAVQNGNDGTVFGVITRSAFLSSDPTSPSRATPHNALGMIDGGYITFDMKVITAPTGPDSVWKFKIEADEAAGGAWEADLTTFGDAPVVGQWTTYRIPLQDVADNGVDISLIDVLMVFPAWMTGADAVFRLDNIAILQDTAGVSYPEFPVSTNTDWALWDCCGGSTPALVTDAEKGQVVEFAVLNGNSGTVLGFNTRSDSGGNDAPLNVTEIAANGVLSFDLKVINAPAAGNEAWMLKVESAGATGATEVNLNTSSEGVNPSDVWQTFTFPIADLMDAGSIDPSALDVIMLFPAWGSGADTVFRVADVKFHVPGSGAAAPIAPLATFIDSGSVNENWALWDCCGGSTPEFVNDDTNGQVAEFKVLNGNSGTVLGLNSRTTDGGTGVSVDATSLLATGVFRFDLKVMTAPAAGNEAWMLKIESGGAAGAVEINVNTSNEGVNPSDAWQTFTFNLIDLFDAGTLDPSDIDVIMLFPAWGSGADSVFRVDNMEIIDGAAGSSVPTTPTTPDNGGEPSEPTTPTTPEGPSDTASLAPLFTDSARTGWIVWDCCGGSTPAIVADTDRGQVAEFTVVASGETVQGFTTRAAVGGSDALLDVSAYEMTGSLSFDLKVVSAPTTATAWMIKIESNGGVDNGGTGEAVELNINTSNEGLDPVLGQWQTFTFDLIDLTNAGLDITGIDVVLVSPAWTTGGGAVYQIDNLQINKESSSTTVSSDAVVMVPFDGSGAALDGTTFTVPASAVDWAGFANDNATIYPFNFADGGTITFTAAIPEGGVDTSVRFRFENAPYPDVNPAFDAGTAIVNSSTATTYTITIPAQDAANNFSSLLMYVDTRDAPVTITDIVVTEGSATVTPPATSDAVVMVPFDGSGAALDGTTFTVPASAVDWAGFANDNATIYPFNFADGGTITFTAAIPEGGVDTSVRFRFENAPYPDVNPAFDAGTAIVNSSTATTYTITIPAQDAANNFSSLLMYVDTRDAPVTITDIIVTEGSATVTPPATSDAVVMVPFDGSGAALDGTTFTVPASAVDWAGFANDNATIYPFNFANGGTITFTAAIPDGGVDTTVRFRFEKAPYPDVNPAFDAGTAIVNSSTATTYTITIPAQDAANNYSSLLMYVDTRDAPVTITDIVVSETAAQ